jgi:hypothetical protein
MDFLLTGIFVLGTTTMNAYQFSMDSGDIASGTVLVYGVAK